MINTTRVGKSPFGSPARPWPPPVENLIDVADFEAEIQG